MGIKQKTTKHIGLLALIIAAIASPMFIESIAFAAPTYTSPSYGVDEVFMGSGGANDMSSANYQGRASLGDTGVGNSSSANYQAYGGFTTNADPYIELVVNPINTDLGYLSTSAAATTTATFTVRTYLASGYVVVNGSDPPLNTVNPTRYLNALSSPTGYTTNTELFGINLVANTSPVTFGADPQQVPGPTYSYGAAAAGYNTTNQFKYVKGDTIASSASSSGSTTYTVSYIYGIDGNTPAGQYNFNHIIIATSTY
ncbi:MAG: hypothetical protein U0491_02985 [Candidatus Saccharimonadales bacterium]